MKRTYFPPQRVVQTVHTACEQLSGRRSFFCSGTVELLQEGHSWGKIKLLKAFTTGEVQVPVRLLGGCDFTSKVHGEMSCGVKATACSFGGPGREKRCIYMNDTLNVPLRIAIWGI